MKITLQDIENEKQNDHLPADPGENSGEDKAGKNGDLSGEEITRRKRVSEMTRREKLVYFWDYYRVPVIIVLVVGVIIFSVVRDILTNRPTGFEAELFNAYLFETSAFEEQVGEALGMDPDKEVCRIETDALSMANTNDTATMYTMQKVLTRLAAGELNVIAGEEDVFDHYARMEAAIVDLRTVLSAEDQAFYESRYVWKQVEDLDGNLSDPAPVGIRLDDAALVQEMELYPLGNAVIGIVGGTEHAERAVKFINYLFER